MRPSLEERLVSTSAHRLSFLDEGDPAAPALLLLHGFPLSALQWRDLIPMFATRFRVIAPNLSEIERADGTEPADAVVLAAAVRELLVALDVDRFAVVGHDRGAAVGALLALDGDGVDAMVLLDASGLAPWPVDAIRAIGRATTADHPGAAVVATSLDLGMRQRRRLDEGTLTRFARSFDSAAPMGRDIRVSLTDVPLVARESELATIDAPVLILWGEDDPIYPVEVAERLCEAMPSSTLGLLPGCGHYLVEEAGETIGPMIHEYLRARYLNAPHGHADTSGVVSLQLERRPPWVDLEEDERDDWFDVDDEEGRTR